MTIAFWCVLVAVLLPYTGALAAKLGGRMAPGANHAPREWLAKLNGWPQRANWFQQNSFEVLPGFAAAVIVATLAHGNAARIDQLALAFIALRLVYLVCYVADWATARSLVWTGGMVCVVWLFLLGA